MKWYSQNNCTICIVARCVFSWEHFTSCTVKLKKHALVMTKSNLIIAFTFCKSTNIFFGDGRKFKAFYVNKGAEIIFSFLTQGH